MVKCSFNLYFIIKTSLLLCRLIPDLVLTAISSPKAYLSASRRHDIINIYPQVFSPIELKNALKGGRYL